MAINRMSSAAKHVLLILGYNDACCGGVLLCMLTLQDKELIQIHKRHVFFSNMSKTD